MTRRSKSISDDDDSDGLLDSDGILVPPFAHTLHFDSSDEFENTAIRTGYVEPPKKHHKKTRKHTKQEKAPEPSGDLLGQIEALSNLCDTYSSLISQSSDSSLKRSLAELRSAQSAILGNGHLLQHSNTQLADFVVDLRNYKKIKNIQDGGFGYVYCARDKKTYTKYAVKVLKTNCSDPDDQRYFLREVGIFAEISHPAVLPFKGFALYDADHDRNPAILTEYMARGSLDDLLEAELAGNPPSDYNNTTRQIIMLGVAAGMAHLHSHQVIHRDLKPGNVLLNDHLEPFITDFGLSKIYKTGKSMSQSMFCGTPLWMAPELLTEDPFGPKVDVYAYAMIIFQILTRSIPFGKVKQFQLQKMVVAGHRPQIPDSIPSNFKKLLQSCWAQDPNDRPDFENIVPSFVDGSLLLPNVDSAEYRAYVRRLGLTTSTVATTSITLKEQADGGIVSAQYEYGHQLKEGIGCQKKASMAAVYLKRAADQGHPEAQAEFGDLLLNGEGVPEDLKLAATYFRKSAVQNCGKGQNSYGCVLAHGWGVPKDRKEAAKYFKMSADNGYPWGQYNYGLRLKSGVGVQKDLKKAVYYLGLALNNNIEDAKESLRQIEDAQGE